MKAGKSSLGEEVRERDFHGEEGVVPAKSPGPEIGTEGGTTGSPVG